MHFAKGERATIRARLELVGVAAAEIELLQGRRINRAGDRRAMFNKGDVDCEFGRALDELLGAIERIDEDKRFGMGWGTATLLRDDRQIWQVAGKTCADDLVGFEIGSSHG